MAKGRGAFKSEKRKKEVIRQKKQEEKRQKRLHKDATTGEIVEITDTDGQVEAAETEDKAAEAGAEGNQEQSAP